ncbi:MAG: hypothetical protein IT456_04805 [Planctomycetes bacterium]|nr:hypothetical protein [Planctomycetota bacterium]MCC7062102.1 hypothetical protein [Planctomycetota bacterium]
MNILPTTASGDERGASHSISAVHLAMLDRVAEMHITTIRPGCIRGNHYHVGRSEVLVVLHADRFEVACDHGDATDVELRTFSGAGCISIAVDPGCSHAIKNTGTTDLVVVATSDSAYTREDTKKRVVLI